MERVDAIVIGAGVIGLAVARALALAGHKVVIVEADRQIGTGISSRSSEVIHAGLYYSAGSLKATLCVAGRQQLYAYCAARGIPFCRTGKLVVAATADQVPTLEAIVTTAHANGVDGLRWLDRASLKEAAPALQGAAALFSPVTGIVDSHALMLALLGEAEAHGAILATGARVVGVDRKDGVWAIRIADEAAPVLSATMLVNATGLNSCALASCIEGLALAHVPQPHWARGSYFSYSGRHPFTSLVYPVPEAGGLGIHLTLDLAGIARFGPDVTWMDRPDYTVDEAARGRFVDAIKSYWPGVEADRLHPSYAGVRPKIVGPDAPAADFRILGPRQHGLPGLVTLFGIESPGLTAALAIADHVVGQLADAEVATAA